MGRIRGKFRCTKKCNGPKIKISDLTIKIPRRKHQYEFLDSTWWYYYPEWETIVPPKFLKKHKDWWESTIAPKIIKTVFVEFGYQLKSVDISKNKIIEVNTKNLEYLLAEIDAPDVSLCDKEYLYQCYKVPPYAEKILHRKTLKSDSGG